MKAISLVRPEQVEIIDTPEPEVGREDVLIEIRWVGLCGSDLNAYRGLSPMVTYPRIPGHEVSGVVAEVGPEVPDTIRRGAAVTVSPYSHCGVCAACRIGRANCCRHNQTLGVQRDGALAERITIHHSKVFTSERLAGVELALVEPLSVGYHAANRGRVSETDRVLVLGCGAVGLGAVAAAARKGAGVVAVDVDDAKLELARKLGATHTANSTREDVAACIADLTDGDGVDVAVEAVGLPATYQMAVEVVAYAGRVVCIGYAKEHVAFETRLFVSKELDIMGSRNALGVFPDVIQMLEERQRPFADLVTRVTQFADTAETFAEWRAAPGSFTKILVSLA